MVTHYAEDVSQMTTECGLTALESANDNVSLDISECTCVQCLSLVICNLSKQLQKVSKESVTAPRYAHSSSNVVIKNSASAVSAACTPVYMSKSPYVGKKQK